MWSVSSSKRIIILKKIINVLIDRNIKAPLSTHPVTPLESSYENTEGQHPWGFNHFPSNSFNSLASLIVWDSILILSKHVFPCNSYSGLSFAL